MIGQENSRRFLDQADIQTKTKGYSFRALFCRVSGNLFFYLKFPWLLVLFSFVLIVSCDEFVFCFNNTLSSCAPIRRSGMFWSLLVSTIINYCIVIMSVDINNCDNIFCNSIFGAVVPCVFLDWKNIISWPSLKLFSTLFFLVSLMESLDSTLETKRPAAALNLLSQQNKPQVGVSSEGQLWTLSKFK